MKMNRTGWLVAAALLLAGAGTTYLGGGVTISGGFPGTFTFTGATAVTFPTSGTLSTTAGVATALPSVATTTPYCGTGGAGVAAGCGASTVLPNGTTATTQTAGDNSTKVATTAHVSAVTTLSSLTSVGTIGTGVWQGTSVKQAYGGTGSTCGAGCLGKATVNMAITTDQAITLTLGSSTQWMPGMATTSGSSITFIIYNCTNAVNQSASTGALYRATSKANALTAVTTFANLTGTAGDLQRVPNSANSTAYSITTVYFAMTAAGSAGTCDVNVMGVAL